MIADTLRQALPRLNVRWASLPFVRTRILIGVGAWLLGAVMATCGSLLAVSLLGTGFGVSAGQGKQLSAAAVNAALASAPAEHTSTTTTPAARRSPAPRQAHARGRQVSSPRAAPATSAAPAQKAQAGTLLATAAGTVVASCEPAGAYLISWSPAQGYGSDQVVRGPAPTAEVTFDAGTQALTMRVSCRGGVPVAGTSWGSDDDGGSGGGDGSGGGNGSGGGDN
jgi:hypothetical protein